VQVNSSNFMNGRLVNRIADQGLNASKKSSLNVSQAQARFPSRITNSKAFPRHTMAGASDKARFYLEQSVPELREWARRDIFNQVSVPFASRLLPLLTKRRRKSHPSLARDRTSSMS